MTTTLSPSPITIAEPAAEPAALRTSARCTTVVPAESTGPGEPVDSAGTCFDAAALRWLHGRLAWEHTLRGVRGRRDAGAR